MPWKRNWQPAPVLFWKMPWTEEPGQLQPTGPQRVRHNWATEHPHRDLQYCVSFMCIAKWLSEIVLFFFLILFHCVVVQLLSSVQLFNPVDCGTPDSFVSIISQSLLKLISIKSVIFVHYTLLQNVEYHSLELKSLLMRVKEESEKANLRLLKKLRSWHLASLSMANRRGKVEADTASTFPLLGLQTHSRLWLQPWNKTTVSWQESNDKPRQCVDKQKHYSADKGPYGQGCGLPSSHIQLWELDHKEGTMPKNWCL